MEMRVLLFLHTFSLPTALLPHPKKLPEAGQPRVTHSRGMAALGIDFAKELGKHHGRVPCCQCSLGACRALGAKLICRNTIN